MLSVEGYNLAYLSIVNYGSRCVVGHEDVRGLPMPRGTLGLIIVDVHPGASSVDARASSRETYICDTWDTDEPSFRENPGTRVGEGVKMPAVMGADAPPGILRSRQPYQMTSTVFQVMRGMAADFRNIALTQDRVYAHVSVQSLSVSDFPRF